MARGKTTVESIDEQIRKLQERKAQLLSGGPGKAELRAAFVNAATREFSGLSFAQLAGALAMAYSRMPIPEEQLAALERSGMEILQRHLPKKKGPKAEAGSPAPQERSSGAGLGAGPSALHAVPAAAVSAWDRPGGGA